MTARMAPPTRVTARPPASDHGASPSRRLDRLSGRSSVDDRLRAVLPHVFSRAPKPPLPTTRSLLNDYTTDGSCGHTVVRNYGSRLADLLKPWMGATQVADSARSTTRCAITSRPPSRGGKNPNTEHEAGRDHRSKSEQACLNHVSARPLIGAAHGHAFRAAELAYDLGVAQGRLVRPHRLRAHHR